MYQSSYSSEYLSALSARLDALAAQVPVWCVFDNTARGQATLNALELVRLTSWREGARVSADTTN